MKIMPRDSGLEIITLSADESAVSGVDRLLNQHRATAAEHTSISEAEDISCPSPGDLLVAVETGVRCGSLCICACVISTARS